MSAPSTPTRSRVGPIAAVAVAGILWGISAVVIRDAFQQAVDPLALVQARLAIGGVGLTLALTVFAPRLLAVQPRDLLAIAVWGLVGLLGVQASYFWAVSRAGVATAVFLQYTSPLLTALWATLIARERLGGALAGGLGLAVAGMAGLLFSGVGAPSPSAPGVAAGALSALTGAFGAIYAKRLLARIHPAALLAYGMPFAFLATLAMRDPVQTARELIPAHSAVLAYVVIGSTLAPFLLYLYGLRRLQPTGTILVAMVEPVVGVLGAWAVLGENLTAIQAAGALLLLVGVVVSQRREPSGEPTVQDDSGKSPLIAPAQETARAPR